MHMISLSALLWFHTATKTEWKKIIDFIVKINKVRFIYSSLILTHKDAQIEACWLSNLESCLTMPQTKAEISIRTSTIKQNAEWLLLYICDECHSLLQSLILTVLVSSGHAMLTEDMLCYRKCINWPYSANVAVLSAQGTIWGGGVTPHPPSVLPYKLQVNSSFTIRH